MQITVRLIGRYKEIIGKKNINLTINAGDTIWNVVDDLVEKYPSIEKDRKFIMVLKNNIYTTLDSKVSDGDEITLSPPVVSGG